MALDLLERFGDQRIHVRRARSDQIAGIVGRKSLERGEKERLPRQWRDPRQPRLGDSFRSSEAPRLFAFLDIRGRPDRMERLVQPEPRVDVAGEFVRLCDNGFERGADKSIAMRLAARQSARVAAKKRQMRSEFLAKRHELGLSLEKTCRVFGGAPLLLQPWKPVLSPALPPPEM